MFINVTCRREVVPVPIRHIPAAAGHEVARGKIRAAAGHKAARGEGSAVWTITSAGKAPDSSLRAALLNLSCTLYCSMYKHTPRLRGIIVGLTRTINYGMSV